MVMRHGIRKVWGEAKSQTGMKNYGNDRGAEDGGSSCGKVMAAVK